MSYEASTKAGRALGAWSAAEHEPLFYQTGAWWPVPSLQELLSRVVCNEGWQGIGPCDIEYSNGLLSEDPRTFAERLQDHAVACLG